MAMQHLIEKVGKIRAATAADADLKARFIAHPMELMAEMGVNFPPGVVLEAAPGPESGPANAILRFPFDRGNELTEEMLDTIAGGAYAGIVQSGGWGSYQFA